MTSFIITLISTTTVVAAASSATAVGGKNDLNLVRKIKNSKKMNANANANEDAICAMQDFLGISQYTNCKREETEVEIACDTTDDTATTTTTTKKICTYSEHPVQYNDTAAAAAAVECGDHGSFDPETHFTRDHASGVCRLKFLRLTSTCIGAPARSGFGLMTEVPPRTGPGTGPGSHNRHTHNEDKHHKKNSRLLLRFSYDAGATYSNNEDSRLTVPLDRSSPPPRRTEENDSCEGGGWRSVL